MSECPVVETRLGKVKGCVLSKVEGGSEVFLYTSLPFAKPPVGELRFEPPVSPDPWDGILDASVHSPSPQQDVTMIKGIAPYFPQVVDHQHFSRSEDCLYLSVYSANPSEAANFPVLIWIYGGAFINGGESFQDGSVLASLHDVVVVIPNYRVSVFGFLSLGKDTNYPGNVGLLDQIMAMKWTRDHIRAFGGNPNNVTIFGESAGGMSVNYHVVSPMSKGLFHRAISHSGSIFCPMYPKNNGESSLRKLKEQLIINEEDSQKLIDKLKSFSTREILKAIKELSKKLVHFVPVIDGKFFPKHISSIKKEKITSNVPYIIGCNNSEGHGIMSMQLPEDFKQGISKELYNLLLRILIGRTVCKGLPDHGYDVITTNYQQQKPDDVSKWSRTYGEIMGDTLFINPAIMSAKHHGVESESSTYMYVMTQQPRYNHDLAFGPETAMKAPFCEADHADDVIFTLGIPFTKRRLSVDVKFTDDEKALSKEWMKYIVNFAKNGDPNVGLPVKINWPQYDGKEQKYLSVQQPCFVGTKYGEKKFQFWNEVVQQMQNSSKL